MQEKSEPQFEWRKIGKRPNFNRSAASLFSSFFPISEFVIRSFHERRVVTMPDSSRPARAKRAH
jgi:hypothetical protein